MKKNKLKSWPFSWREMIYENIFFFSLFLYRDRSICRRPHAPVTTQRFTIFIIPTRGQQYRVLMEMWYHDYIYPNSLDGAAITHLHGACVLLLNIYEPNIRVSEVGVCVCVLCAKLHAAQTGTSFFFRIISNAAVKMNKTFATRRLIPGCRFKLSLPTQAHDRWAR